MCRGWGAWPSVTSVHARRVSGRPPSPGQGRLAGSWAPFWDRGTPSPVRAHYLDELDGQCALAHAAAAHDHQLVCLAGRRVPGPRPPAPGPPPPCPGRRPAAHVAAAAAAAAASGRVGGAGREPGGRAMLTRPMHSHEVG